MWDASAAVQPSEWLPVLDIPEPERQRRLTVLLRLLLLIPQLIVLWLLGIAAFVVAVIGWFGALFLGRLPGFAARFLSLYVAYDTRVFAYLMLLVDRYPPFRLGPVRYPGEYPVGIEVRPGELNRLAVFFRLILVIPAAIVQALLMAGWWAVALILWLVVLIVGETPRPLFEATSAVVRFRMRTQAYVLMLASAYPKRIFGDPPGPAAPPGEAPEAAVSATRPLVLSTAGKVLLVVFLVIGVGADIGGSFGGSSSSSNSDTPSGTVSVVRQLPAGP
jgi:hypothetical protein